MAGEWMQSLRLRRIVARSRMKWIDDVHKTVWTWDGTSNEVVGYDKYGRRMAYRIIVRGEAGRINHSMVIKALRAVQTSDFSWTPAWMDYVTLKRALDVAMRSNDTKAINTITEKIEELDL